MVQAEPWLERDKAMIDPLKTIGIERGKPFNPDAKTKQILNDAIQEAKAWFDARYDKLPPYYEGERWFFPTTEEMYQSVMSDWKTPDSYPIDARGTAYTLAFFSAKHLGQSQYYLLTGNDKDGKPLDGKSSYRLRVPANAPVTQYWSMTVYNRDTHTFIRNAAWVGRSSQTPGLQKNADGSVDIFFGPAAPAGKESNWVPTDPNGRFEVLARFYGPQKPLFDKTWKLPDIEKDAAETDGQKSAEQSKYKLQAQTFQPRSRNDRRSRRRQAGRMLCRPGPDTRVKITEEYARHVARDAFFWAWPLVNVYNKRLAAEKSKELAYAGPVPSAPLNRIVMLTDYVAAEERIVACPNQDVVYGGGSLGLDQSPVVIQAPDFGDRFWVYQAVDLRTDGFVRLGKMYGTTPGFYLLAGPGWRGDSAKGHHSSLSSLDQHRVHRAPHLHGRYVRGSAGNPAAAATDHDVPARGI